MGALKAHTWKELVEQAEIAEKSAKKFEFSVPKNKWRSTPRGVMQLNLLNQKGKKIMVIELSGTARPKQKNNTNGNQEFKFPS